MTSCNKLKSFKVVKLTDKNLINDGKDDNGGEDSDEDVMMMKVVRRVAMRDDG